MRRGTKTETAIQPRYHVSLRKGITKTWAEKVSGLPRSLYEELEKNPSTELGATEEGHVQELRWRLFKKGKTPEKAMRAMRV